MYIIKIQSKHYRVHQFPKKKQKKAREFRRNFHEGEKKKKERKKAGRIMYDKYGCDRKV